MGKCWCFPIIWQLSTLLVIFVKGLCLQSTSVILTASRTSLGRCYSWRRVTFYFIEEYWKDFCRNFARSSQHFSSGPAAEVAAALVSRQNYDCSGRWIGSFFTLTAMRLHELHSLVFWVEQFRRIHPSWVSHQVAKQTIKGWEAGEVGSLLSCCAVGRDCCGWLLPSSTHNGESWGFEKGGGGKRYLNWCKSVITGSLGLFKNACLKNWGSSVFSYLCWSPAWIKPVLYYFAGYVY